MKLHALLLIYFKICTSHARRGPHHPHGQTPVDQHHHHYRPQSGDQVITGDSQLLHDTRHLQEDTKVYTKTQLDKMTPDELEFFYFSTHDFDHNNKLDGLELLKAIYHTMEHEEEASTEEGNSIEEENNDISTYVSMVDRTLDTDDTDDDGYISYTEYRAARTRNAQNPSEVSHERDQAHVHEEKLQEQDNTLIDHEYRSEEHEHGDNSRAHNNELIDHEYKSQGYEHKEKSHEHNNKLINHEYKSQGHAHGEKSHDHNNKPINPEYRSQGYEHGDKSHEYDNKLKDHEYRSQGQTQKTHDRQNKRVYEHMPHNSEKRLQVYELKVHDHENKSQGHEHKSQGNEHNSQSYDLNRLDNARNPDVKISK